MKLYPRRRTPAVLIAVGAGHATVSAESTWQTLATGQYL
jgi:hypothetical protein